MEGEGDNQREVDRCEVAAPGKPPNLDWAVFLLLRPPLGIACFLAFITICTLP